MRCPYCDFQESKVIDSRPVEEGNAIRRRRECIKCEKRFTTYEKIETIPVMVVKKDSSREQFSRTKVMNGMLRSCEKRPVAMRDIEMVVNDIESRIMNSLEREVTTETIGVMVMERLKQLDEVAYVRFASVYREFKDINTFMDELHKLLK